MIGRLRGQVPAERLLWSLADGTMLESWQREGAQADWLALATLMEVAHAKLEAALQGGRRTLQAYGERVRRGEGAPGFRRNPDHALHNFACMCIWSGQLPEAVFWFRRLLAVGQPSAWSHLFLAECPAAQGDVRGARSTSAPPSPTRTSAATFTASPTGTACSRCAGGRTSWS